MSEKVYLRNTICDFYPLFDINYRKKKILISVVLFKLYEGCYKSFDKYTSGLKILSKVVEKYDGVTLRLFIDDSIYTDGSLMKFFKKLSIEIVHFIPKPKFVIDNHLKGLFGTFIRFFPMFNFPNNDCDVCVSLDIDHPLDEVIQTMENLETHLELVGEFPDTGIFYESLLQTNRKYYNIKYGKLLPYFYAGRFLSLDKFDKHVLVDFLENVETNNELLTVYGGRPKASLDYTNFVYGIDEYFTNNVLMEYIENTDVGVLIYIEFNILSHLTKRLSTWDLKVDRTRSKFYKNMMGYILGDKFYEVSPRKSFLTLKKRMKDPRTVQRLIETFILSYTDGEEHDILSRNIMDVCTNSLFLGVIDFKGYISYNDDEVSVIVEHEEKLPQGHINKLKKFKLKHHAVDLF